MCVGERGERLDSMGIINNGKIKVKVVGESDFKGRITIVQEIL